MNHTLSAESVDGRRYSTPSTLCVSVVEFAVDLIQLTLQPEESDISVNPEQMGWFPPVVVKCS